MFYTNKSLRLHSKALGYLELIQQCNNRYEDKRSTLRRYDASKVYHPLRLMYERRQIVEFMERWQKLSEWLIVRYQNVFTELGEENLKQLRKAIEQISNDESIKICI